jgi:hypothetical protein
MLRNQLDVALNKHRSLCVPHRALR